MKKTFIFAHRGVSEFAPENTLPAFEMAMDLNCDGIEFDVHLSKDGIPVIIHDETINRTSNGSGNVIDYTFEELKKFDFGINFNQKYNNVGIPTLQNFFELVGKKKYKGLINIEIKNDQVHYINIEKKILELIDQYQLSKQILISSFNHKAISIIRNISQSIKVALLYDKNATPDIVDLINSNAYSANIYYLDATEKLVKQLQDNNIQLFCYTVNSGEALQKLIDIGVDGVFTNNPGLALEIRNSQKNV